jgi:hypothetical protein
MRIELRDTNRRWIGQVAVDPAQRPTRVRVAGRARGAGRVRGAGRALAADGPRELFLEWDTALDDAGHLRRCVMCGCPDLFAEKAFPQVTAFVVVLAFAGAVVGALGYATTPPVLTAMAVVLVLDVAIFMFSRRRLVCYRCRTSYHDLGIARYIKGWDRATADRHAAVAADDEALGLGRLGGDEVPS